MARKKIEHYNPDTVATLPLFSRAVAVEGGKTIYVSGMTAMDQDWNLVGAGDLGVQARVVYDNLKLVLDAAGATPADVVRQRIYIVDIGPEGRFAVGEAMNAFFGDGPRPASSLSGVTGLAREGALIEIDFTCVIDA